MARGNDGNLLQHTVESALTARLVAGSNTRGLCFTCTHSMGPFEPIEPGAEDRKRRFKKWWQWALTEAPAGTDKTEPAVLRAYRSCRRVETDLYPNSAEIVSASVGRERLRGSLVECDQRKHQALAERWRKTGVRTICGSWRDQLDHLTAPENLDRPWLFTMDPMSFGDGRPDRLLSSDFQILLGPVKSWIVSKQPGVFCVFCYSMDAARVNAYCEAMRNFRKCLDVPDLHVAFARVGLGGIAHVGALVSLDKDLAEDACTDWNTVRDLT